jgi:hypothetical protein
VHVAAESEVGRLAQLATQHVARIGPGRRAVGHGDVAEHAGRVLVTLAGRPRQNLERRRIRLGDGVGLGDAGESFDGAAVEADSLVECTFEFSGRDGHRFEVPEDVGEPEADETNVALFESPEHEFLLTIHERESKQTELNLCYIVNSVSLRGTFRSPRAR